MVLFLILVRYSNMEVLLQKISKGIKAVFGYEEDQVGDNSSWWFGNIHPEDSKRVIRVLKKAISR